MILGRLLVCSACHPNYLALSVQFWGKFFFPVRAGVHSKHNFQSLYSKEPNCKPLLIMIPSIEKNRFNQQVHNIRHYLFRQTALKSKGASSFLVTSGGSRRNMSVSLWGWESLLCGCFISEGAACNGINHKTYPLGPVI